MAFFFLILVVLLVLLILLWLLRKLQPPGQVPGGFGTQIEDPYFQPVPRPPETFIDPPRQNVDIQVRRDAQGVPIDIDIGQRDLQLKQGEQAAWSGGRSVGNNTVKVEIRFSPNASPFGGSSFATARSGVALSGKAFRSREKGVARKYTILATTTDGFLLTKTASVTPADESTDIGQIYESTARQSIQPPPEGGYGERIEDPGFEPIDRPEDVVIAPSKEVRITVLRGEGGRIDIVVEPEEITIGLFEQVAWKSDSVKGNSGAKLEIRFAPNATPFNGDTFIVARGGTVFSGLPMRTGGTFEYKILVTTPDGIFQIREKDAKVTISG